MSKLDQIRALREARYLEAPPPKWGKPGRPAKKALSAAVVKLPRPAYRKRPTHA